MADVVAALAYAKRGWPVLPLHNITEDSKCTCETGANQCGSRAKHPRINNWVETASTDPDTIKGWWETPGWEDSNIGVLTGKASGLLCVDIDSKSNGIDTWNDLIDLNSPVDTLVSLTGGGGYHYIFECNGEEMGNTVGKIGPGIDTRGEAGFIVVSPSVHESGNLYQWDNSINDLAPMPKWLKDLWGPDNNDLTPVQQSANEKGWAEELLRTGVGEGNRNATIAKLAGYFHRNGTNEGVIKALMEDFNEKCSPPLPLQEVYRTVESVLRYENQVVAARVAHPPDFREQLNTLTYTFRDLGLVATVDNPHRKGDDELRAELSFDLMVEGLDNATISVAGPLGWGVTSPSARNTLVTLLNKRHTLDWHSVLQDLSRLVVEHNKAGRDLVDLRHFMERPWAQFCLEPFILDELPTILFGFGGLGKSLFGLIAMASLNTGVEILPGFKPEPGHRGLFCDWESSSYEHGIRYGQIMRGIGLDPNEHEMLHLPLSASLDQSKHTVARHMEENGVTFLIIDSAAMAAGGDPTNLEKTNGFFATLRTLRVPSLIIAHQTKGNERETTPFGSVFWHNQARATHQIAKQQSPGENILNIAILNQKMNNGPERHPLSFQLDFSDDMIKITQTDIQDNPTLSKRTTVMAQVRDALWKNIDRETKELKPMTLEEIALEKDIDNRDSLRSTLNRWKNKARGVKLLEPGDNGYRTGDPLYTIPDIERNIVS